VHMSHTRYCRQCKLRCWAWLTTHRDDNVPRGQVVPSIFDVQRTLVDQVRDQRRSHKQRQGVDKLVNHRISDVGVFRPDITLGEDGSEVGPPGVSRPPEDLFEEPPVRLHRREQLGLFADLDIRVPAMRDHPPREELVVARVEVVLAQPEIVREPVQEVRVLEDDGPVRGGPAGQARDTAIDVRRRGDLDVSDGKSERSEDLPDGKLLAAWLDALRRADSADLLVFKAREHIRQECGRPDGIIVSEDDDVGGCVSNPVGHLQTFVCKGNGEDTDAGGVDRVGELLKRPLHLVFRDDDDLFGGALEP